MGEPDVVAACEREAPAATRRWPRRSPRTARRGGAPAGRASTAAPPATHPGAGGARPAGRGGARAAGDAPHDGRRSSLVAGPAAAGEGSRGRAPGSAPRSTRGPEPAFGRRRPPPPPWPALAASLVARGAGPGEGGLERRADALARRVEVGP
ncbi:MAG: hypothetical protein KF878_04975 [Planctomycetes bacterium]|nr:hypothetical protein [Planctomycetota bacterium]